jgi:recombination protein RecA
MARLKKTQNKEEVVGQDGDRLSKILSAFDKKSKDISDVIVFSEDTVFNNIPVIPSGILSLDKALGIGGFPQGRIVEIFGLESSGKSSICLQTIASAQKQGGLCAYVDVEHAFDASYARDLGINLSKLLFVQPDSGEQALNTVERLIENMRGGDLIVVDSIAALVPQAELDGEMNDQQIGLQARLLSKAMRKLAGIISKSGVCLIFVNQLRQKVGVFFGNNEVTTGGNSLKYYSSIRLDVRKGALIKKNEVPVGNKIRIKVVKNKLATPFSEVETDLIYGKAIPRELDILILALDQNIIQKSGSWLMYDGKNIGQGEHNVYQYMVSTPEFVDELEAKLKETIFKKPEGY